jgi:hypothetical protein
MTTGTISATNYTGFDALGRVTASNQVASGQTYPFRCQYLLTDAVSTTTYPSGRQVVVGSDTIGRLSSVVGYSGTSVENYVTPPNTPAISYAAHRAILRIPAKTNTDSEGNANGIPGRRRTVLGA